MEGPNAAALQALHRAIFVDKRRVTFITGAGISVKSGIPLYRSDKSLANALKNPSSQDEPTVQPKDSSGKPVTRLRLAKGEEDDGVRVVISDDEDFSETLHHNSPLTAPAVLPSAKSKPVASLPSSATYVEPDSATSKLISSEINREKRVDDKCYDHDSDAAITHHFERTAIWDAKLELLATRDAFLVDPRNWYARFWFDTHHVGGFLTASPNESHLAIAAICNSPTLRVTCITQNVDNLHRKAGIHLSKLIEIHGRIGVYRCSEPSCYNFSEGVLKAEDLEFLTSKEEDLYYDELETLILPLRPDLQKIKSVCSRIYDIDAASGKSDYMKHKALPCCPICRAPAIPITLLFDETYATHAAFQWNKANEWIRESEVVVFCGTSFSVYFTEHTTEQAREFNKEVFNLNIKMDIGQFYGFHTTQNLPPLVSTSIRQDKKIILNFDSDPESVTKDSEDLADEESDSPLFSSSSQDSTNSHPEDKSESTSLTYFVSEGATYKHKSDFPVIHHVVGPADELLLNILPKASRDDVASKMQKIQRATVRRCWDIPPSLSVVDDSVVSR